MSFKQLPISEERKEEIQLLEEPEDLRRPFRAGKANISHRVLSETALLELEQEDQGLGLNTETGMATQSETDTQWRVEIDADFISTTLMGRLRGCGYYHTGQMQHSCGLPSHCK